MPKRDKVWVTRCKDCAYGTQDKDNPSGYVYCEIYGYGGFLPEDWYCANGTPKEEKEDVR